MRAYYYLLFRIYRFYTDKMKEDGIPLFYTCTASSLLIGIPLFIIYVFMSYFGLIPMFQNKYMMIIPMSLSLIINYFFFIRPKKFLECNFNKDVKGGVLIILFIIAVALFSFMGVSLNRAKIFAERELQSIENVERKPSLEGDVRKWFEHNF